jgi:mono/diheme cytochrome c family protein
MKRLRAAALLFFGAGVAVGTGACHPKNFDPMEEQPKLKAYAESDRFDDGRAMRTPPAGTIPRERELSLTRPPITADLMALGRLKFDVTCAVCHGLVGDGEAVVAHKMSLRPPPSLHEERIRALPVEVQYRVVSEGYGLMPGYAGQLTPRERWAVLAYLRALQLSQSMWVALAPRDLLSKLDSALADGGRGTP